MRIWIGTALLTIAIAAGAQESGIPLVQPEGNQLQSMRVSKDFGSTADFRGRIEVTGTLVAEWTGGTDSNYEEPDYSLVPDAASIARLPHFSGYDVRHIDLRNGRHALFMAVGEAKANALLDRKVASVEAMGTFVVTDYSVGVECDASWARATLVSARIPDRAAAEFEPIVTC